MKTKKSKLISRARRLARARVNNKEKTLPTQPVEAQAFCLCGHDRKNHSDSEAASECSVCVCELFEEKPTITNSKFWKGKTFGELIDFVAQVSLENKKIGDKFAEAQAIISANDYGYLVPLRMAEIEDNEADANESDNFEKYQNGQLFRGERENASQINLEQETLKPGKLQNANPALLIRDVFQSRLSLARRRFDEVSHSLMLGSVSPEEFGMLYQRRNLANEMAEHYSRALEIVDEVIAEI